MAKANPLWGAPRIHGELLKLGIEYYQKMSAVQTSIANMADFLEEPYAQHLYHINMIDIQGTKVYDFHM